MCRGGDEGRDEEKNNRRMPCIPGKLPQAASQRGGWADWMEGETCRTRRCLMEGREDEGREGEKKNEVTDETERRANRTRTETPMSHLERV